MSELVTGEAVALEMRLARFPSRSMAFALDLLVLLVVGIPLLIVTGLAVGEADPALAAAVTLVVVVGVLVGIPVTVETLSRGRSLGKLLLGLRVVRDDGGPVRFRSALVRGLAGFFVDFWLTFGAGAIICSLLNAEGKRVGDLLAGTVVVRERAPAPTAASLPPVPPALAAWAIAVDLGRLPDGLALSARTYLARLPQLDPATSADMGARLATAVAAYVSPPAPLGTPAWAYLAAVLAERSRREAARWSAVAPVRPTEPAAPPVRPADRVPQAARAMDAPPVRPQGRAPDAAAGRPPDHAPPAPAANGPADVAPRTGPAGFVPPD